MQIDSGKSGSIRHAALQVNSDPRAGRSAPPVLSAREEPGSSFFPASAAPRGTSSSGDSGPQFHHHHDASPELTPALQDAIAADDWAAVETALKASPGAGLEHRLMQHAARAGAAKIIFRLQGLGVSPFAPNSKACGLYVALQNGNGPLAAAMLKYEKFVNRNDAPDLTPIMEAAVDDNAGKAISWLVEFSVKNKCDMPFRVLKDAIVNKNPRQVEIMISHPAFVAVLKDPEAEHLVLREAVRRSNVAVLTALLARKRSAASLNDLCRKTDANGDTLLHMAAAGGDREQLKLVMDANPDICREGASDSFFARLMRGDQIDLKNKAGKTARALANDAGHVALVAMLDARGARP